MKDNHYIDYLMAFLDDAIASDNLDKVDDKEIPFADTDICPYEGDCSECPFEKACAEEFIGNSDDDGDDDDPAMWGIPDIVRVVFSDPATIVFWEDGTKTVVKCMKGERFERYAGFAAACMKKMFGSTSRAKAVMDSLAVESEPKKAKRSKGVSVPDLTEALNEVIANHESVQEAVDEALSR